MRKPLLYEALSQIELICRNKKFVRGEKSQGLLYYLVRKACGERAGADLKEIVIAVEHFGIEDYDPKKHSSVRVAIKSLRQDLEEYYATEGRRDRVLIEIPMGSYLPVVFFNPAVAELSDQAAMNLFNAKAAFGKRTLSGHEAALRFLDLALREHPDHPRIIALNAMIHLARAMYGLDPRVELNAAQLLLQRANLKEETPWEYLLARAWIKGAFEWKWGEAEALFSQAISASHGEARYDPWYTSFLASQLRFDEELAILTEAVSHFGRDVPFIRGDLGLCQIMLGHLEDAEQTLRSTLELFPKAHYLPYLYLAIIYDLRGNGKEALRLIEEAPGTPGESKAMQGIYYYFVGRNGDHDKARRGYEALQYEKRAGPDFIDAFQVAMAAIGASDYEGAVTWLKQAAIVERDPKMIWAAVRPFHRHLYANNEFRSLIKDTMRLELLPQ
jgi:tetratricopeptide (TPR) repeat protein